MAELIVETCKAVKIEDHPNADRLDLITIKGWQCVAQKGIIDYLDLLVYIPVDSILPEKLETLIFGENSKVKLSKSRVKTIKLRGAISQGLVVPAYKLKDHYRIPLSEGKDVKDILGITKWEPKEKAPFAVKMGKQASKKQINPNFRKYTNINHLKNYQHPFEPDEEVVVLEKIHGCLQANTKISLSDGSKMKIKDIVENRLDVEVLSMNNRGQVVPCKILNWFDNGKTKEWKRVKFTRNKVGRGNHYGSIVVTPNHRFYNPKLNQYVPCSDLKDGDDILLKREKMYIPYYQKQVLIGKMLGDGSLNNNSVCFGHKKEHEEYVDYTLKSLGCLSGNKQKNQISGYGSEMCRGRSISAIEISDLFSKWGRDNKKQLSEPINLSPISLAFWYMDDGSLTHTDDQEDRISIATCGFDEKTIEMLIDSLYKLGIESKKYFTDKKYFRIHIDANNADKLFTLISPYVISCMEYKLPKKYRGRFNENVIFKEDIIYKPSLVKQRILEIVDIENVKKINLTKYDIETKNHNFIANGVVVHNSNFRAGYVPAKKYKGLKGICKRIYRLFNRKYHKYPGYEFVFGSHNVQLQKSTKETRRIKKFNKRYHKKNVYEEIVNVYNLREKLLEDEVVYGEIYGANIQKKYNYGLENDIDLVCFDIKKNDKWIDTNAAELVSYTIGVDFVPVLYRGMWKDCPINDLVSGPSVLCPEQKVREGVVVKSAKETTGYMGRKVFKFINPEYLLAKGNSEWH